MDSPEITSSPTNKIESLKLNLRQRTEDPELVQHPDIRQFVSQLLDERLQSLPPLAQATALEALNQLVPAWKDESQTVRQIAGQDVKPHHESRIRSRETAEPVPITQAVKSLPAPVQQSLFENSDLIFELTGPHCTVGCWFCHGPQKGPIVNKMDFDDSLELVNLFTQRQPYLAYEIRLDVPYGLSDPFDALWLETNDRGQITQVKTFLDWVKAYREITQGKRRVLSVSTAIPLGEELRVLQYALEYISWRQQEEQGTAGQKSAGILRLSRTKANQARFEAIETILHLLYPNADRYIAFTSERDLFALKMGALWALPTITKQPLHPSDISGNHCRDGQIFTIVDGQGIIQSLEIVATSNQYPHGEHRQPFSTDLPDGSRLYRLVHRYHKPGTGANLTSFTAPPAEPIPYLTASYFHFDPDGSLNPNHSHTLIEDQNPHRAALRIATFLETRPKIRDLNSETPLSSADQTWLKALLPQPDIALIAAYLQVDPSNVTMQILLDFIARNHLNEP